MIRITINYFMHYQNWILTGQHWFSKY